MLRFIVLLICCLGINAICTSEEEQNLKNLQTKVNELDRQLMELEIYYDENKVNDKLVNIFTNHLLNHVLAQFQIKTSQSSKQFIYCQSYIKYKLLEALDSTHSKPKFDHLESKLAFMKQKRDELKDKILAELGELIKVIQKFKKNNAQCMSAQDADLVNVQINYIKKNLVEPFFGITESCIEIKEAAINKVTEISAFIEQTVTELKLHNREVQACLA